MTATWLEAWSTLEAGSNLTRRDGQQILGESIFSNVFNGGQLVAEGPTGIGKSFTALIPAICAFKEKQQRTILTTETLSLLDQIVDKDLPFLQKSFGDFTYFGLKGRNHYLCIARAGGNNAIVQKVRARLVGTNGERRDVEKILGRRLADDVWAEICGDTEFCAQNRCNPDACWSTAARTKATNADIVITSHTMLQIHGEFIQQGTDGGLLGDFHHIIVDEAHSLERIVVDGSTLEVAPWEMYQKLNTIRKGIDLAGPASYGPRADELEKRTRDCIKTIQDIFTWQVGRGMDMKEWKRQSMGLKQIWVNGAEPGHEMALDAYENTLPEMLADVWQGFEQLAKDLIKATEDMDTGAGKVKKAATACRYLSRLFWLVGEAVITREGTCEGYGTTFAVFADGYVGRDINNRERQDIRIRAVPLDVSQFLKRNLWKTARSTTLISATLRDHTDGSFRFLKKSLGLEPSAVEIVVDSPFKFSEQMLIHLTSGERQDIAEVKGAKFSIGELKNLILASKGRSLVLFTSIAELEYTAESLRKDKSFPYTLLVQEKGADKAELATRFKEDTHSVLLASKTFFQGFDVPGEALTSLILCKYSLPQYNATTIALINHWKKQGFPKWYEMKSIETFVQAWGRLIRSDGCRGVVSLLDERVSDPRQSIYKTVHDVIPAVYGGVEVTGDVNRVAEWLDE